MTEKERVQPTGVWSFPSPKMDTSQLSQPRPMLEDLRRRIEERKQLIKEQEERKMFGKIRRWVARLGLPLIIVFAQQAANALEEVLHGLIDSSPTPEKMKTAITCMTNKIPEILQGLLAGTTTVKEAKEELIKCAQ